MWLWLKRIFQYLLWGIGPPMPPTSLRRELDVKQAFVKLFWEPSVSPDVVSQELEVYVGGESVVAEQLLPEVSEYAPLVLDADDNVLVKVRAFDGFFDSPWAVLEFVVPELDAPLPPMMLGWEIMEVKDVLEEEPVEEEPTEEPPVVEPPVEESPVEPVVEEVPTEEKPVE